MTIPEWQADDKALVEHLAIETNQRIANYVGEYIAAIRAEQNTYPPELPACGVGEEEITAAILQAATVMRSNNEASLHTDQHHQVRNYYAGFNLTELAKRTAAILAQPRKLDRYTVEECAKKLNSLAKICRLAHSTQDRIATYEAAAAELRSLINPVEQ